VIKIIIQDVLMPAAQQSGLTTQATAIWQRLQNLSSSDIQNALTTVENTIVPTSLQVSSSSSSSGSNMVSSSTNSASSRPVSSTTI